MSKEKCINKKLHPYYKTGINGWIGEEVDDNDYILCPICGEVLGMNYYDYSAENNGDTKCPRCRQEIDYSEIYEFEDTLYFEQLLEIKDDKIADLETKLAESEKDRLMWQEMYKNADKQNKNICETDIYPLQEENQQLKQQLIDECKEHQEFCKVADEKVKELKQQLVEKEKERHEEWITGKEWKWECDRLKRELEKKENEVKQLYPFIKKYDNGIFIEYNVVQEREGFVSTTAFGKNKELAYNYLKQIKGEK